MGQLFVKGVWVTNGKQDHNLGSGLNLYHMRLDRDRRAVVHSSDLESQAAALWVRAIDAETPGADVRRVAEFISPGERPRAVEAIALEFLQTMGHDAVPVAQVH